MTGSVREGKRSPDPPLPSPPMVDPRERETKRQRDPGVGGGSARAASTAWNRCMRRPCRRPQSATTLLHLLAVALLHLLPDQGEEAPLAAAAAGRRKREVVLYISNDDDDLALIDVTYPKRDVDNMQWFREITLLYRGHRLSAPFVLGLIVLCGHAPPNNWCPWDEKGVRDHPRDPDTPIRYIVIYISGSHALCTSLTATSPSTPSACFLSTRTAEGWRGSSHSCTTGVSRWPASVRAM
uniref:Uncharacterized protein n=1 Tax=Oryza glumipatula TaxID=40148 RepID=A0A0E0AZD4_9ORYZ